MIIDAALWDNHWCFNSMHEKAKQQGITHNEYMAKYFVRNIKNYMEAEGGFDDTPTS